MLNFSLSIMCALALISVRPRATAQTRPAKDFQQWTNVAATWQVKPKLEITTFVELHFGNDVSQLDQELVSAGITYSPKKRVSIGTGYLYVHANPKLSGINYENRIYGDVTFIAPAFHNFLLSDRVQAELRWVHTPIGATFTQRYRNRVTLTRPINKYSPFVMWEKFYNANVKSWSRTRYYVGVTMLIDELASVQFYFMRQNDDFTRPFHNSAIGASVMFNFGNARRSSVEESNEPARTIRSLARVCASASRER